MNDRPDTLSDALEKSIFAALETYSNVHRGSGHFSVVTTRLYEKSRDIVLDYLKLDRRKFTVVFCSPRNAGKLTASVKKENYRVLSSSAIGLPLGICAVTVRKKALPEQIPFMTGGGTARLVGPDWVVRTKAPSRFEPGTPPVINVIAFARALQLTKGSAGASFRIEGGDLEPVSSIVNGDEHEIATGKTLLEQLNLRVMGKNVTVPGLKGPCRYAHFDYAASTPALLPVWHTFRKALWLSETSKGEIAGEVRSIIASFLNAPLEKYDVLFTQNTTEAINLVADSYSRELSTLKEPVVLNSIMEHNSDDLPWRDIQRVTMVRIPVNADGFFDFEEMERLLREYNQDLVHGNKRIDLVAVCGASNVLSTFNDLELTSRLVHRYGARLLVDAAQMVAHRQVDISHCQIDYLVFSGHKIYAPFGTGVLVVKKGLLAFSPQEKCTIQSLGDENIAGIAALGRSISLLQRAGLELISSKESELTGHFLAKALDIPELDIYGISDPASRDFSRKGGVISFSIKGWMPNRIAGQLAMEGIGIRNGCHCTHLLVKHMLKVPGWAQKIQRVIVTVLPGMELPGVARVSLGLGNTAEEMDHLIRALTSMSRAKEFQRQNRYPENQLSHNLFKTQLKEWTKNIEQLVFGLSAPQ